MIVARSQSRPEKSIGRRLTDLERPQHDSLASWVNVPDAPFDWDDFEVHVVPDDDTDDTEDGQP